MSTIRARLTSRLLLGWSALLAAGGMMAYAWTRAALTRQFDEGLRTKSMALMSLIEQEGGRIVVDRSDEFMREFQSKERPAFFELWRADGTVVERSESLGEASLTLREGSGEGPVYWDTKLTNGISVRAVGWNFEPHPADEHAGTATQARAMLVVAADRHDMDEALATMGWVLAGSGLLVLALTAAGVPLLLRRELAPLNRLAGQAQRITAESLDQRFPEEGLPEELAPVTARLNDLLGRLEESFARERQFSDDIAHEFRTPIAELRSLAELALKWPEARGGETDRQVLAVAVQMEGVITRLLAIARSRQGRTEIASERVDLAALVSGICEPLKTRADARRVAIETDVKSEIQSDPVLLRSIVSNLADNAVEYSAPGGTVRIEGEAANGCFMLRVSNLTEGLNTGDLPRMFERFWRRDAARTGTEHAGLGLPLSRAFATSLGYELSAKMNGDARLTMTLSGPTKRGEAERDLRPGGQNSGCAPNRNEQ